MYSIVKMWTSILIADLLILQITDAIHVGVGISDITGPAAGTPMVTFIELPNTYFLDAVGSSQIFFPTQDLGRAY
jgi:hypothetical protein